MSIVRLFAARVRELREAAEMTQADLAARMRVPRTNVVRLESGARDVPISTVARVAKALGVRPGELLEKP